MREGQPESVGGQDSRGWRDLKKESRFRARVMRREGKRESNSYSLESGSERGPTAGPLVEAVGWWGQGGPGLGLAET